MHVNIHSTQPLSVLLISPDKSEYGGVTAFAEMLKNRLVNCRFTSFSVGGRKDRKEYFIGTIARLLSAPFKILQLVNEQPIDVIHINPSLNVKSVIRDGLILFALRSTGFKHSVVYIHGWRWKIARGIERNFLFRRLFAWLLNGTAGIMVLSPEFKQCLSAMGVRDENIIVTRTMFDGNALTEAAKNPAAQTRRTILYMSRFLREKGVHELLDAFAHIANDFPDVDLIMAGAGPEEAKLHAQAASYALKNRIFFPGYVQGAEKFRLLQQCAFFALPTNFAEGMPIALLEAMGAGKALLTAKAGAIPTIIDSNNGIVLESVTTQTVEDALHILLNNPDYCAQIGQYNAAYAWNTFEAGTVLSEMERLYRKIALQ